MPTYDFRCEDTGKRFQVSFDTYEDYDNATVTSPFTGSTNVKRVISKIGIKRSQSTRFSRLAEGDPEILQELDESGPSELGAALRHLSTEAEFDMGEEFNEVVDRLEDGQTPEDIESSMPEMDDGRWLEGLGQGVPGTESYEPEAPPPPGMEED